MTDEPQNSPQKPSPKEIVKEVKIAVEDQENLDSATSIREAFKTADYILSKRKDGRRIPSFLRSGPIGWIVGTLLGAIFNEIYFTDPATQLPSRAAFKRELDKIISKRKANIEKHIENAPCTIVFCDINHFKSYNTDLTHEITDKIIIQVARLLKQEVQKAGGIVARSKPGGDEFLVMFEGKTADEADAIMKKVNSELFHMKVLIKPDGGKITNNLMLDHISMVGGKYELDSKATPFAPYDTSGTAIKNANTDMVNLKNRLVKGEGIRNVHDETTLAAPPDETAIENQWMRPVPRIRTVAEVAEAQGKTEKEFLETPQRRWNDDDLPNAAAEGPESYAFRNLVTGGKGESSSPAEEGQPRKPARSEAPDDTSPDTGLGL